MNEDNQTVDTSAASQVEASSASQTTQSQNVCHTNILSDEPESNDAFAGPHERIAVALARLIRPADAKGISIGLEGSWGSGKSTVAKLLIKKLESDKDIAIISFDAWAHEGDPLRRTFLETLIRRLQDLGDWVKNDYWNSRIEELANRREVVTTKDTLTVTKWGRVIAFTLLLVPIGGAFIAAALREDIILYPGSPAWKFLILFFLGLALTFTPFFILLSRIDKQPDILSLLFNKGPTEKTTETSKTVNPTSIEFEENFTALLEDALKDNQKRIVVILDNLDRVDPTDALSIWSTLQTFLQHKGSKRPTWHERLWLLVLYDIKGLSQLWQGNDESGAKTAVSFIDKSFQIRFEVPALVLSDWRSFLTSQLDKAFPDHSESDRHEVYRVLAIRLAQGNRLPTIRELKLYVNQIGSIHRQWAAGDGREADAFPLAHIAYYVLLRREGEDIVTGLLAPRFPTKEYQDLLGSTVRENLAALAFNVEIDVAQQLLFADRIKSALTVGSSEELKKVASLLRRGFWEIFEQIATTEWAGTELVRIADAALALEESGLLSNAPSPSARSVTKSICELAVSVQAWYPMDKNKAKGLATLLKWKNDLQTHSDQTDEFVDRMFKAIALGLTGHAMRADLTFDAKDWLDCLMVIVKDLQPAAKERVFRIVVETLSEQLRLPDPLHAKQLEPVLEVLSEMQDYPDADSAVKKNLTDLADNGQIAHQLSPDGNRSGNSVAWVLYIEFRYASRFGMSSMRGKDEGETGKFLSTLFSDPTVQTFTAILERFKQLPLLFTVLATNPEVKPLVVSSLRTALKAPEARALFAGDDAIERLEFVSREIGNSDEEVATLNKLIVDIFNDVRLVDGLTARDFDPANARLYLLTLTNGGCDNRDFVSWCLNGLNSISFDQWKSQLERGGAILNLAFDLKRDGSIVELGQEYYEALEGLANQAFSQTDKTALPPFRGNVADLLGPIDGELRNSFRDHLSKLIGDPFEKAAPSFFSLFGIELTTHLLHSTRGARIFDLFNSILESRDASGLDWISKILAQDGAVITTKYSKEANLTKFRANVRRDLGKGHEDSTVTSEVHSLIHNIANHLNIKPLANGLIAFAAHDLGLWQIHVINPDGSERAFLESVNKVNADEKDQPVWSPDGRRIAYTAILGGEFHVSVVDVDRGKEIKLTEDRVSYRPAWAPDGQTLAFARGSGPQVDVYTIHIETKEEKRLTQDVGQNEHPNWSPDGSRIAFHRVGSDNVSRIFVMNLDGSDARNITAGPNDIEPSWSPDGTQIAFARRRQDKQGGIYLMSPEGTEVVQLAEEKDPYAPVWSPDGTKILFQVSSGVDGRIYQVDVNGKNKKTLTAGINPSWQPITREIETPF